MNKELTGVLKKNINTRNLVVVAVTRMFSEFKLNLGSQIVLRKKPILIQCLSGQMKNKSSEMDSYSCCLRF